MFLRLNNGLGVVLYRWGCCRERKEGSKFLFRDEFALNNKNGLSFWFFIFGVIFLVLVLFLGKWRNGSYTKYGLYRS